MGTVGIEGLEDYELHPQKGEQMPRNIPGRENASP